MLIVLPYFGNSVNDGLQKKIFVLVLMLESMGMLFGLLGKQFLCPIMVTIVI